MDSSRAWLTIVADNNDEGEDDYNDDDDDDGLRAGRRSGLTHRHVRRSSTRVNVTTDKEWNNCLEFCQGEM